MEMSAPQAAATVARGRGVVAEPTRIGMLVASTGRAGGGVSEAVRSLALALDRRPAMTVDVFTMSAPELGDSLAWGGARLHHHVVRGPASFGYAPALGRSLAARRLDVLHLHGLWMYPSIAARTWTARTGRPCVISPHGMLDAWALAHSGWKKRLAGRLYEDGNLRRAACLHALCGPELEAVRTCGLTGPVCVIPNGVDLPPATRPHPPPWRRQLPSQARVLLYLGRLHPKKGVLELVQAWDETIGTAEGADDWHLVVAGPGPKDYVDALHAAIGRSRQAGRVRMVGPQFGDAKLATLAAADAFILPSWSEGLPMAALEAWAWQLPALLTDPCNLPEGFAAGAAMRIVPGPEGIAAGLRALLSMSDDRRRIMGRHGRSLVGDRFTWPAVAAQFDAVYRWLQDGADRPACVDIQG